MSKVFRPWDVDEVWLFPASVQDFVPPGHIAHLIRETVREGLDLRAILSQYDEERGYPPYHPGMMTALLLYAYSQGISWWRRMDRACHERVDFMAVTGLSYPDFRTISEFRKRHLGALSGLFVQVLGLCRKAGLVKLGHVALDGTKIKANASKHKAMSYGRMKGAEEKLAAEVAGWMKKAAAQDAAEDRQHGGDRRGDELPDWVANKERRVGKNRQAKAALGGEAQAAARGPGGGRESEAAAKRGRKRRPPSGSAEGNRKSKFNQPQERL